MAFAPYRVTLERRLHAGVEKLGSGCWRWLGAHGRTGYGVINVCGCTMRVHRVAFEVWCAPIPSDKEINHTCHVRDCINPYHLEAVSHAENIRKRSGNKYRLTPLGRPDVTHCHYGHEYTDENSMWYRGKYRQCRTCHGQNKARRMYLRKAG